MYIERKGKLMVKMGFSYNYSGEITSFFMDINNPLPDIFEALNDFLEKNGASNRQGGPILYVYGPENNWYPLLDYWNERTGSRPVLEINENVTINRREYLLEEVYRVHDEVKVKFDEFREKERRRQKEDAEFDQEEGAKPVHCAEKYAFKVIEGGKK